MLALTAARKSFARAFCFGSRGGGSSISVGKRLFRTTAAQSAAKASGDGLVATPPESPFPPGEDGDLVSFFLLRHGQTNFNAIGRIQVRVCNVFIMRPALLLSLHACLFVLDVGKNPLSRRGNVFV